VQAPGPEDSSGVLDRLEILARHGDGENGTSSSQLGPGQ
jgi:hypothetical protein